MTYRVLGYHYTWWRGDPRPALAPLPGFQAAPADDYQLVAALAHLDLATVHQRVQRGSQPYVAFVEGVPVAYGWSASNRNAIEELGLAYTLSPAERDLWDFATLPAWRGRGIYACLLRAVIANESEHAERFWIGHTADNTASQRGIRKAGFQLFAQLVLTADRQFKVVPVGRHERARLSPLGQHLGLLAADGTEDA